jgi:ADP-dependent NAD(P)H-hydrate dehydratase / NAD(P)H-hydrate epimerase
MQAALPALATTPLHGNASTRRIEAALAATLPPHTLMRRAGLEAARLALAVAPHARMIWVAAGPGNNGGDGWEAAFHLRAAGKNVRVSEVPAPSGLPADAHDARQRALAAGVQVLAHAPPPEASDLAAFDLAIDALLGLGSRRAPEGVLAECIAALNRCRRPVLAVDLPSGLCADTGRLWGEAAVRATHTLSLLTLKPGLFTGQGRDHTGQVYFANLGQPGQEPADANLIGQDSLHTPPAQHSAHKGSRGDTLVVGGASGMAGAAQLAARAALAAGSGRVYVSLQGGGTSAWDPERPELMQRPTTWPDSPETLARCTVLAGCGGGDAIAAQLPRLLSCAPRLVLDADALNAIAQDTMLMRLLQNRAQKSFATVLTPHPLEAARLLACQVADVQASRLTAASQLADQTGAMVVLKGSGTLVAAPTSMQVKPWINSTGNAALATAGTGDVLAGWLAGSWAARRNDSYPALSDKALALRTSLASVYLHGLAADRAGVQPLRAADLIEAMFGVGNGKVETSRPPRSIDGYDLMSG